MENENGSVGSVPPVTVLPVGPATIGSEALIVTEGFLAPNIQTTNSEQGGQGVDVGDRADRTETRVPPSVARCVHYVTARGKHLAAIVTGVPFGPDSDHLNTDLHVLPWRNDSGEWTAAVNLEIVRYDPDFEPNTWHWPERV